MPSEDIVKLEFPEHVRRRPGMYVGSLNDASVILREAIDNSVDELYSTASDKKTKSDTIWITNYGNKTYRVCDNGRGIPIKESSEEGVTMARLAVSSLNAGSKFQKTGIAIGQNGVGISCTNALSSQFEIMSRAKLQDMSLIPEELKKKLPEKINDNTYYFCYFENGLLINEGFKDINLDEFGGQAPSTITSFSPDKSLFRSTKAYLPTSLRYVKYILTKMGKESHIYMNGKEYSESLDSFGMDIDCTIDCPEQDSINPNVRFLISFGFQKTFEKDETIGSVNGLDCGWGVHIKWAHNAFCKAFKDMFSDCRRNELMGTRMSVIALCNEPSFASQTKERLADIDGFKASGKEEIEALAVHFRKMMRNNYDLFKQHEMRVLEYMKSTEKIGRKEMIKSTVLIAGDRSRPEAFVPNKLIDCSTSNREEAELYICEGRSASGSLVKARDPKIHAILPLRG